MKLAALGASAIALTLALTPPAKALDNVTRDNVALSTAAIWVTVACPGYEMDDLRKAADLNGVDFSTYAPAIYAGLKAQLGQEYDRNLLIPEVTREVRQALAMISTDVSRNKTKACRDWSTATTSSQLTRRTAH